MRRLIIKFLEIKIGLNTTPFISHTQILFNPHTFVPYKLINLGFDNYPLISIEVPLDNNITNPDEDFILSIFKQENYDEINLNGNIREEVLTWFSPTVTYREILETLINYFIFMYRKRYA
jgi:hypothetical protein